MPLTLALRQVLSRGRALGQGSRPPSVCLFCSFTKRPSPSSSFLRSRQKQTSLNTNSQRHESTDATDPPSPPSNPRVDLETALADLQAHAPNYVNLARVQLARRNLTQPPGHESIRIALLGLKDAASSQPRDSGATAKKLLRLALVDPLRPAEEWEARLEGHDLSHPLIVRVGAAEGQEETLAMERGHVIPEIKVSSPVLDGGNLEILVMGADSLAGPMMQESEPQIVEDAILAPTVEIATPGTGRSTSIAAPVHMALVVGDGVLGAASIIGLPILEGSETIAAAVNFKHLSPEDAANCPFTGVSVEAGGEGLELFRASVGNSKKYEALWTKSNVGHISEWLRANVLANDEARTKAPVRNLIASLLRDTSAAVQAEEARDMSLSLTGGVAPPAIARLNQGLSEWAQNAHEELQQRLEIAFTGRSWRKLGWWKLFWRADDVGMLSSEMLAQRFLPKAERDIIYLSGRVQEAGVAERHTDQQPLYSGPASPPPNKSKAMVLHSEVRWPTHITFTRTYLQEKTVPALQALAQKLVLQSSSGVALTTALGGLTYLSAFGAYESGAVAALGLVWSLGRLQRKWEVARDFWESEVREEGRKAIRATEASVAEVLDRATKSQDSRIEQLDELRRARAIIQRGEEALARLK
ncbi:hypothetical protein B0H67DRAFT_486306 [Lasiosphaeris hirsuta]|uniref:Mmc1 C-terminal domain-containing protein n=1 Tax=Lasiosphaeris hirsuta TaxID=260670 RepID=A0AA40AQ25_9PEZI|nr:hypothetical protein B0H67DRAFT_486306 [Lasiosphaeris hirsuta]